MVDRISEFAAESDEARALRRGRVRRVAWTVAGGILLIAVAWVTVTVHRIMADPGKIVARVNGEPIHEADVEVAIPLGAYESDVVKKRQEKLDTVCKQVAFRQFLAAHHVTVPESAVDRRVEEMRQNPPSLGCPCCRYGSLDLYLEASYMTMDDLRAQLRMEIGQSQYGDLVWKQTYPTPESQQKLIASRRAQLTRDYVTAWQIFFNTFQAVDQTADSKEVAAYKRGRAQKAWERLQKGEPFDKVAREMSDDQVSRPKGGALGDISKTSYGKEFAKAIARLKPGEVSKPIRTPYGFHIIKWQPISDDALLSLCKEEFARDRNRELAAQIERGMRVDRT